jgi:hypothetical protein
MPIAPLTIEDLQSRADEAATRLKDAQTQAEGYRSRLAPLQTERAGTAVELASAIQAADVDTVTRLQPRLAALDAVLRHAEPPYRELMQKVSSLTHQANQAQSTLENNLAYERDQVNRRENRHYSQSRSHSGGNVA